MDAAIIHATAASYVLLLGAVQVARRRRDRVHRRLGRTWLVAMYVNCLASFAIHPNGFSWLHGLAIFTLVGVTLSWASIRRGNVRAHATNMIGSYLGTLVAFGFAAVMPNRLIARLAVDQPGTLALAIALIVGTAALIVVAVLPPAALTQRAQSPVAAR